MINEKIIKKLKQTNISVDAEKTKVRVLELWKAASKAQKLAVEEAAGISRATIYRVYNTGSISAKLVTPMAQSFNVDPNYLIGKTNASGECTVEILISFLTELGYGDLLKPGIERAKRLAAKEKAMAAEEPKVVVPAPAVHTAELTLADLHLLMQSLLLREKAGVEEAINKAAELRALLLS